MVHVARLRNRRRESELVKVTVVNGHDGFPFNFHFVCRDPASADKRREHDFPNFVQRGAKRFRDLRFENRVQILIEEPVHSLPRLQLDDVSFAGFVYHECRRLVRRNEFHRIFGKGDPDGQK